MPIRGIQPRGMYYDGEPVVTPSDDQFVVCRPLISDLAEFGAYVVFLKEDGDDWIWRLFPDSATKFATQAIALAAATKAMEKEVDYNDAVRGALDIRISTGALAGQAEVSAGAIETYGIAVFGTTAVNNSAPIYTTGTLQNSTTGWYPITTSITANAEMSWNLPNGAGSVMVCNQDPDPDNEATTSGETTANGPNADASEIMEARYQELRDALDAGARAMATPPPVVNVDIADRVGSPLTDEDLHQILSDISSIRTPDPRPDPHSRFSPEYLATLGEAREAAPVVVDALADPADLVTDQQIADLSVSA